MTNLKLAFPDGFLIGAATSAHQTEGDNTNSNWWHLETSPNSPFRERSGIAVDSYRRYPEDMRLLAEAGLDAYRFSIEWARIEPRPGEFDQRELAHYREMIDTAMGLGLTPVVTLHHFTNPMWFAQSGGWGSADAPGRFAAYVREVSRIVADVPWICTINEPNMIALLSGMSERAGAAEKEPDALDSRPIAGLARPVPSDAVTGVLTAAHREAADILHAETDARIGWTVSAQGFEAEPGAEEVLAEVKWAWEDRYLEVSRDDDFVGVQSYTARTIGPEGLKAYSAAEQQTMTGWPFRPDAVGPAVRNAWEVTRGTPILVTENGIATEDDQERIEYIAEALTSIEGTVRDGVDVRGYIHWSALDNYEWGEWGPTFGLIAVDRETLQRLPRPSLEWLGSHARGGRATAAGAMREAVEAS